MHQLSSGVVDLSSCKALWATWFTVYKKTTNFQKMIPFLSIRAFRRNLYCIYW